MNQIILLYNLSLLILLVFLMSQHIICLLVASIPTLALNAKLAMA